MSETVTILRGASATDRYRNPVVDWANPTRTDVDALAVAPTSATEDIAAGRDATVTTFDLYLPATTDLRPTDRVEVRGAVYDVDGEPADWRHPRSGRRPGLVATVRRVDG